MVKITLRSTKIMSTRNQLILIRSCSFAVALKRALKSKPHLYSTKCLPHTILLVTVYSSNVFQPTDYCISSVCIYTYSMQEKVNIEHFVCVIVGFYMSI